MIENPKNHLAERCHPDSLLFVVPEEADQYVGEHFFCPDVNCLDPKRRLFVKHNANGAYFSHYGDYDHTINPETLLHKTAVKYFEALDRFEIKAFAIGEKYFAPSELKLDVSKTRLEYNGLKTIRPDIVVTTTDGFEFAIEIFVTHETKQEKKKILDAFNLPALEIELHTFYCKDKENCKKNMKFVEQQVPALIADINLKAWIIAPKQDPPGLVWGARATNPGPHTGCLTVLLAVASLFLLSFALFAIA